MSNPFIVVTVTYNGDFALFKDLCYSIDCIMPEVEHHVLVDHSDFALFAPFGSKQRKIIDCSVELPEYHELNFGKFRIWWRWPNSIVRGWIYQQLIKIHYVKKLTVDAAVVVDSDAVFVRPITKGDLFDGHAIKLYHCPGKTSGPSDQSSKWHDIASKALGLEPQGYTGADYISTAVCWSPAILREAVERIEATWQTRWDKVLTQSFRFSEYILYGVFCQQAEGTHRQKVTPTTQELCHCSWGYDLSSNRERERFTADLKHHHRAILIQSNLGMPVEQRHELLAQFDATGQ